MSIFQGVTVDIADGDLTAVAGTYVSLTVMLTMAQEGLPADKELPFKHGEPWQDITGEHSRRQQPHRVRW